MRELACENRLSISCLGFGEPWPQPWTSHSCLFLAQTCAEMIRATVDDYGTACPLLQQHAQIVCCVRMCVCAYVICQGMLGCPPWRARISRLKMNQCCHHHVHPHAREHMRPQTCINARAEGMIPTVLEIPSKENPYDPAKVALPRHAKPLIHMFLPLRACFCMHACCEPYLDQCVARSLTPGGPVSCRREESLQDSVMQRIMKQMAVQD